jgi:hypothetical protein
MNYNVIINKIHINKYILLYNLIFLICKNYLNLIFYKYYLKNIKIFNLKSPDLILFLRHFKNNKIIVYFNNKNK